jgi:hypothetical protein
LSESSDAFGGQDQVAFRDALGGRDRDSLEKHWEAVSEEIRMQLEAMRE